MHICAIYTHCRRILYQLSHKGSPRILEWVAYSFSSRSSWPRNRTGVSCIEGEFFTNWAIREAPIYTLLLLLSIYTTMYKIGGGNGNPLQYSCLENPMDGGAWWAAVHDVTKSRTRLSDFTLTFHFHALEKEMATHPSILAWRIPGTVEPGGLPSMGSHRVGHDWSDLVVAADIYYLIIYK